MLARLLALSVAVAVSPAVAELPETIVTGMLEYASQTAFVVWLNESELTLA